jgi:hypothetical protein
MAGLPLGGNVVEALPAPGMDGALAGVALPAPDGGIDVERIDFDAATAATDALGGDQRRAACT